MEEILKSGLINLTELAVRIYPDKDRLKASNTLRAKVHQQTFNKLSRAEKYAILEAVNNFHIELIKTFE